MDDGFDDLLAWLDPNRETAGQRYEVIRTGLIRIFVSKGFSDAEDLADMTILRVTRKLPEIEGEYVGEKERYFHGVARNIVRERRRRKEVATGIIPERTARPTTTSDRYDCLLECLKSLLAQKRELILDYYLYEGKDKAEHHRRMAEEMGIGVGALRTRAHHIRRDLEKCVRQCVGRLVAKQKTSFRSLLRRRHLIGTINKERQP
jgi:RNA polymerase sigma factor (sigma-70 family)